MIWSLKKEKGMKEPIPEKEGHQDKIPDAGPGEAALGRVRISVVAG